MQLNHITTNIRLRSPWEAIDLGFAMTQHYWRNIFPSWLLLLLTFTSVIWLITPNAYKHYTPLILWWLKPLYDRVLLHIYSRQLFNEPLTAASIFSSLPHLITKTGLLGALTWRRLSLSRGFNLAIWQLEQLRGKAVRDRQRLLHLQTHSQALWLTIGAIHLEYVIIVSTYALIFMLDPSQYTGKLLGSLVIDSYNEEIRYWGSLLYLGIYAVAIFIIEPLYIAASFSLYLNRRTQLEAWDIELAFRSLNERLMQRATMPHLIKTTVGLLCIGCTFLLLSATSMNALAAPQQDTHDEPVASQPLPPAAAKAEIEKIMQRDEFNQVRTIKHWQPKKQSTEIHDPKTISQNLQVLFANILKGILWIAAIILIVLGIVYRQQILNKLRPRQRKTLNNMPPDILFGMDIRPESLPDDIATECQRLWHEGQQREALSLLYRAALMYLTRHDQLPIHASHTEGDILQLARQYLTGHRIAWLTTVTYIWQELAYAHRPPADQRIMPLFKDWLQFSTPTSSNEVTT